MHAWERKEAIAMLKLQGALDESIVTQADSDTDVEGDTPLDPDSRRTHSFKLPRRLRGWLYLLRSGIKQRLGSNTPIHAWQLRLQKDS